MLSARLKEATSVHHQRLEQDLDLLRPGFTLAAYRTLLERFYGFYAPWEARAEPVFATHLPGFYEERRKTPLLETDLRTLGATATSLAAIPRCLDLPKLSSLESALGSAYVVEGSTLGGQILSRHFEKYFEFSEGSGYSFFRSYGPEIGSRWRSFIEILNRPRSVQQEDEVIEAGRETFLKIHSWLCSVQAESLVY